MLIHAQDAPFCSDHISDNLSKTSEGFLICHNVPVARTGVQKYYGREIGLKSHWDIEINVYRLEQDVFDKATIASFEGKPVTDDHPATYPVTPDNFAIYAKGHVQNARVRDGYIVADLVITDPLLISKIELKQKRQVSAGYDCNWPAYEDGLKQTDIRANHVAVVETGRAGAKVAIKDSIVKKERRKIMNKQQAQARMLAMAAKNATPEEIEELMPYVMDSADQPKKESAFAAFMQKFAKDSEEEEKEKKEAAMDARINALDLKLTNVLDALTKMSKDETSEEELSEKMAEDSDEEDCDEEKKKAEDEEGEKEDEEEKKPAEDSVKNLIKQLNPILAKMNAKDRKAVKGVLDGHLGRTSYTKSYSAIKTVTESHAKAADNKPKDASQIGKAIAEAYNPHYATQVKKLNFNQ